MGKKKDKKFCKILDEIEEHDIDEGSLEVCDCEGQQVCDVCQRCGDGYNQGEDVNQGHYFEIMDRTHVVQCNIDDFIADSPAMTPKIRKRLDKAQKHLCKVYQWASSSFDSWE